MNLPRPRHLRLVATTPAGDFEPLALRLDMAAIKISALAGLGHHTLALEYLRRSLHDRIDAWRGGPL